MIYSYRVTIPNLGFNESLTKIVGGLWQHSNKPHSKSAAYDSVVGPVYYKPLANDAHLVGEQLMVSCSPIVTNSGPTYIGCDLDAVLYHSSHSL